MKQQIAAIETLLLQGNCPSSEDALGLYDGAAGNALVCLLLSKRLKSDALQARGRCLLDLIAEEIGRCRDLSFATGLCGIGWAMEWIVQHGLIEAVNTNEVLGDVDDVLYGMLMYSESQTICQEHGIVGMLNYFLRRVTSVNANTERYRHMVHNECVAMLTEALANYFSAGNTLLLSGGVTADAHKYANPLDIGSLIYTLGKITVINGGVIEELFEMLMQRAAQMIAVFLDANRHVVATAATYGPFFYLAVCFWVAAVKRDTYFRENAQRMLTYFIALAGQDDTETPAHMLRNLMLLGVINMVDPTLKVRPMLEQRLGRFFCKPLPSQLVQGTGLVAILEASLATGEDTAGWEELILFKGIQD